DAPQIGIGAEYVVGGGRSQVDDDALRVAQGMGAQDICETVGADLAGDFVIQFQPQAIGEIQRLRRFPEHVFQGSRPAVVQARNHRSHRSPGDAGALLFGAQQTVEPHGYFIHGGILAGGQAPAMQDALAKRALSPRRALEEAYDGIGIADVHHQVPAGNMPAARGATRLPGLFHAGLSPTIAMEMSKAPTLWVREPTEMKSNPKSRMRAIRSGFILPLASSLRRGARARATAIAFL